VLADGSVLLGVVYRVKNNDQHNPAMDVKFTLTCSCAKFVQGVDEFFSDVPFTVLQQSAQDGVGTVVGFVSRLGPNQNVGVSTGYYFEDRSKACKDRLTMNNHGEVTSSSPDPKPENNVVDRSVLSIFGTPVGSSYVEKTSGGVRLIWVSSQESAQLNLLDRKGEWDEGHSEAFRSTGGRLSASVNPPLAYKVYSSPQPNVQPIPQNLFATLPGDRIFADVSAAPPGSYFVLTAVGDSGEGPPSNEVGGSLPTLKNVSVDDSSIAAKGSGFTDSVEVLFGGVPFASPAKVKKQGKKITQSGNLVTGQSLGEFMQKFVAPGSTVFITFINSNGNGVAFPFKR
jgi:hypothetical protein